MGLGLGLGLDLLVQNEDGNLRIWNPNAKMQDGANKQDLALTLLLRNL